MAGYYTKEDTAAYQSAMNHVIQESKNYVEGDSDKKTMELIANIKDAQARKELGQAPAGVPAASQQ